MMTDGRPTFLASYEIKARNHIFVGQFAISAYTKEAAYLSVAADLYKRYDSSDMKLGIREAVEKDLENLGVGTAAIPNVTND